MGLPKMEKFSNRCYKIEVEPNHRFFISYNIYSNLWSVDHINYKADDMEAGRDFGSFASISEAKKAVLKFSKTL